MGEEEHQLKILMVIEVLGSPKEHVEKAMKEIIGKLESDKRVKLLSHTTYDAEEQELSADDKELVKKTPGAALKENKLWSTFTDIELLVPLNIIPNLCFDYMPSSIEILEPIEMKLKTVELTDFFSDIQAALHKFDMMVKNLNAENTLLKRALASKDSSYKISYK